MSTCWARLEHEVIDQGEAMSAKIWLQLCPTNFWKQIRMMKILGRPQRGFLIVSSLMDDVVMTSEAGHNKFILTKRLEESELIDGAFSS